MSFSDITGFLDSFLFRYGRSELYFNTQKSRAYHYLIKCMVILRKSFHLVIYNLKVQLKYLHVYNFTTYVK
jgi:hypothetical protein